MIILTKKRYCFRNGDVKVETAGGGAIETVPDWVAETPLFKLASEGGNIYEMKNKGRTVTEQTPKKAAKKQKAAEDVPATEDALATEEKATE